MTKINFVTPYTRKPTGGLRVINELAQQLSDQFDPGIWPNYKAKLQSGSSQGTRSATLSEKTHWIIAECQLPYLNNTNDIRGCYSIFVQNPYILFTLKRFKKNKIINNLVNAKYIFCISEDAEVVIKSILPNVTTIRVRWAIDREIISKVKSIKKTLDQKQPIITYMPRKCFQIQKLLETRSTINEYQLVPLRNLQYKDLIQKISRSSIFISLSEYEGFAAPPVEAYALGNTIVGYAGNGNEKLFRYKNFYKIEQNNFKDLIEKLEYLTSNEQKFDTVEYEPLMSKFCPEHVANYNQNQFKKLDLSGHCKLNKYISYPRTRFGSFVDAINTKLHEI